MTEAGVPAGHQPFRPRARLMLMLGVELISSEAVALSEVVKNSYDADASTVLVSLRDSTSDWPATLTVMDDGSGMSAQTVAQTWFEPATPSRRRQKVSPAGRRSLGDKGIGRFATAKLAHRLELITYSGKETGDELRLGVDWDSFENDEKYLDQIEIPWTAGPPSFFGRNGEAVAIWRRSLDNYEEGRSARHIHDLIGSTHGTVLRMEGLRASWDDSLAREISRTLSRLISPAADEALEQSERDFRILLDLPIRLASYSGWLGPSGELSRPHYRDNASIKAIVDSEWWLES